MGEPQFGPKLGEGLEQGARPATRIGNPEAIEPRRYKRCEPAVAVNCIDKIEDK
jgi:hypothetical protein